VNSEKNFRDLLRWSCHFLFEGNPNYGCCPDCGKPTIREAEDKETAEYWYYRKVFAEAKPA
jgi:rRNA maturation endonuclease Nob1